MTSNLTIYGPKLSFLKHPDRDFSDCDLWFWLEATYFKDHNMRIFSGWQTRYNRLLEIPTFYENSIHFCEELISNLNKNITDGYLMETDQYNCNYLWVIAEKYLSDNVPI